MHRDLSKKMNS